MEQQPPQPGSQEFGQETARNAWRWLHYRGEYIKSLEPIYAELDATNDPHRHGLHEDFTSYAEKLEFFRQQQEGAEEQLEQRNSVTFRTFADLETERLRRQQDPEAYLLDPFALEEEFALRSLCRVLDGVTSSPDAEQLNGNSARFTHQPGYMTSNVVEITRRAYRKGRVDYILEEHEVVAGRHGDNETLMPLATYYIDSRPHAIRLWAKDAAEQDTAYDPFGLLELAHDLDPTRP